MTKKQFKNLKIGDVIELNGRCRGNEDIRCYVDWNEITYAGANIVNSKSEG